MRAARTLATFDDVELGDHICWHADSAATSPADVLAYVADGALYGDKIVVVGSAGAASGLARDDVPSASVILDLPRVADPDSVLAAVRREARTAARGGLPVGARTHRADARGSAQRDRGTGGPGAEAR
ncbi:hypothetical protein [Streptomyces prasinus]|uniref:hypothetical protein n=1 Tax=Streptomyces prasinus TaxID=67345 RepID=UPI002F413FD8